MKRSCLFLLGTLVCIRVSAQEPQPDNPAPDTIIAPPMVSQKPAPTLPVPVPRKVIKATPMQQVVSFYATVNEGYGAEGMREMLSTNPVVQPADTERVANAFAGLMAQMGRYLDFEVLLEREISSRVRIMKTVANFEKQPFVNEFTFYDPGNGEWRLVHLRYDSNVATMFVGMDEK